MNYYDIVLYHSAKKFGQQNRENMGINYLAGALRDKNLKVKILDSLIDQLTPEESIKILEEYKFKVIGISFLSFSYKETKLFIELLREKFNDITIIVGGHFASFAYKEILKDITEIDYIIVGEGEYVLPQLTNSIINNITPTLEGIVSKNNLKLNTSKIKNLDDLPFPARDYLPKVLKAGGSAAISTSRGCYGNCTFCSVHTFYQNYCGKKWRGRSPENVIKEIKYLIREYNINTIDIIDDNFVGPGSEGYNRAMNIANLIIQENIKVDFNFDIRVNNLDETLICKWKQAGLKSVLIGIESIVDDDLKFYRKDISPEMIREKINLLNKYGINYNLGTLLWHPYVKIESIIKNIEFLNSICYYDPYLLSDLNVYKGTAVEKILSENNNLYGDFYLYKWDYTDPIIKKYYDILVTHLKKGIGVFKYISQRGYNGNEIWKLNQNLALDILKSTKLNDKIDDILNNYNEHLQTFLEIY